LVAAPGADTTVHAPADTLLRIEWRPLAALIDIVEDWRSLVARALEPNVFYEPAFALAAAPALGADVRCALVWAGANAPALVGLFPVRIDGARYGLPLRVLTGWTHPFAPLGTPLVDRDLAQPVLSAWLNHLAHDPVLPQTLLLPLVPDQGPFAAALAAALARGEYRSQAFDCHQRALLAPSSEERAADRPHSAYLERALPGKKRKELRRQRRRLEEALNAPLSKASNPTAIGDALVGFLTLEASGWKGRAGTAAIADEAIRAFMTRAVMGLAAADKAAIHRLMVGDRAVAAAIILRSRDRAWFWKIAYDEALARFSPGVLLAADVTEVLVADPAVTCADSCATADHPMIDHIWRERLKLCDRLIAVGGSGLTFALVRRLEAARRAAIRAARRLRDWIRGR
jgi:CelD/BcsL family acetyltransferase involved in cellulose biosynthesis